MMEFVVKVKGLGEEEDAQWVLAVDPVGERFLIVHEDRSLHWVPMAECTFIRVASPDIPRPVVAMQPQPKPTPLALPSLEAMRHRAG